jgi:hypothetical protein
MKHAKQFVIGFGIGALWLGLATALAYPIVTILH